MDSRYLMRGGAARLTFFYITLVFNFSYSPILYVLWSALPLTLTLHPSRGYRGPQRGEGIRYGEEKPLSPEESRSLG
jgi:hypothetical protein